MRSKYDKFITSFSESKNSYALLFRNAILTVYIQYNIILSVKINYLLYILLNEKFSKCRLVVLSF